MRKIVLALSAVLFSIICFAQGPGYPQGIYMSVDDIASRTPSQQGYLTVQERGQGDIRMNGGNDYKLVSEDRSIKPSAIRKKIWAYSDGEELYLNCRHFDTQLWYTRLLMDGKYMVFRAGMHKDSAEARKANTNAMTWGMFGLIGATVGAVQNAKILELRFLYVLDKKSGIVTRIDPESIRTFLAWWDDLSASYENEADQADEEVLLEYLGLLNQAFDTL